MKRMFVMKWKYIILLSIFVIISVLSTTSSGKAATGEAAKHGVMVIPPFSEHEIIKLTGEWEFYWQKLLTPYDFLHEKIQMEPLMAIVPHSWTNEKLDGRELPLTGYGTYRLQIQLPETELGTVKAIYMPSQASAYTLWIDGKEKSRVGIVGTTREGMKAENNPKVIPFFVKDNPVELIIQISNFHQRNAGLDGQLLIGEPETILKYREKWLVYRAVIIASVMMIGLYHFVLFGFRKKELSFLFFAIVCIVVAIRAILLEEGLAYHLLSFLNWGLAVKLEYLGASLGTLFIALFTYTQFPEDMNRRIRNFLTVVLSGYSLFIILTPAVIFTRTMVILQGLIILIFLYILYVYLIAARRKREGSWLNTAATVIMFLTVLNDILFYNKYIDTAELASVGLFFFLFTQAIILSKRFSKSFARAEQLSQALGLLNSSLEQQVKERTQELEQANEELFNTNQRLSKAQHSKNKWIRNISHEIAAPLTNIRSYSKGMIDGVIPADQQYLQLIYDQSLFFSRMLHDLHDIAELENNRIKFNMERVNIRDFVRSLYEKYKWDLESQGIDFVYKDLLAEQADEFLVLFDPTRIEQVIVNLLSNAQRFVEKDGKIILEIALENDEQIIIKVIDNGSGIKEEELEHVFNRFYKSSSQGKTHNGAGLGLAIAKEIIDSHKGKLSVESQPGKGSCFYFSLPI